MAVTVDTVNLIRKYFPADQWGNAILIVWKESGGNPAANNTKGEDSRGLFQINVGPGAHPQLAKLDLFDPETNVQEALKIWQASGWKPWSTATGLGLRDSSKHYTLEEALQKVGIPPFDPLIGSGVTSDPVGDAVADTSIGKSITDAANTASQANEFLSYLGVNAALIAGRVVLVGLAVPFLLLGTYFLIRSLGD